MFKRLYRNFTSELKNTKKYRILPAKPKIYTNFSSNDYLALSKNAKVIEAAKAAGDAFGTGSTGSRLLSGNSKIFEEFESQIAKDKKLQSALIFNSGYQANISVLSCLLSKKVLSNSALVFFDKLNHASLYQSMFLSSAQMVRYRHNDMQHLSDLLNRYSSDKRPKFIVTETVFGMDGDVIPIHDVVEIATRHNAFLYLDEAHATGVIGEHGYGLSTTVDLNNLPCLVMGTLSKALGASGGYIACDYSIYEYIINCCSGFIYSTALSPMVIGAAAQSWSMVKGMNKEREHIMQLGKYLKDSLTSLGYNCGNSTTNILPVILGGEKEALDAQKQLHMAGINVSCVRPPSVPPNTSRLRIAINVSHNKAEIDSLIKAISKL